MFLILIKLNLVSGHRFHAHSLDRMFSGGKREEGERKREMCFYNPPLGHVTKNYMYKYKSCLRYAVIHAYIFCMYILGGFLFAKAEFWPLGSIANKL